MINSQDGSVPGSSSPIARIVRQVLGVVVTLLLCSPCLAAESLIEALKTRKVEALIRGMDAIAGDAIQITVRKTPAAGKEVLNLSIPAGTKLISSVIAKETIVVMKVRGKEVNGAQITPATLITLSDSSPVTYILEAYSIVLPRRLRVELPDGSPAPDAFEPSLSHQSDTHSIGAQDLRLARLLLEADRQRLPLLTRQAAVWISLKRDLLKEQMGFEIEDSEWTKAKTLATESATGSVPTLKPSEPDSSAAVPVEAVSIEQIEGGPPPIGAVIADLNPLETWTAGFPLPTDWYLRWHLLSEGDARKHLISLGVLAVNGVSPDRLAFRGYRRKAQGIESSEILLLVVLSEDKVVSNIPAVLLRPRIEEWVTRRQKSAAAGKGKTPLTLMMPPSTLRDGSLRANLVRGQHNRIMDPSDIIAVALYPGSEPKDPPILWGVFASNLTAEGLFEVNRALSTLFLPLEEHPLLRPRMR